ncbi:bon1-associated protein 2-like [Trifolium pratense]|uniref:Bon1-associated protein 2-like n=1 Tax=Trifolium pratense TaxID=57577 RepID=A0A2K3LWP6_TRIPR|nr:bon1-associated protein 2-like [Trifolium pratense]
MSRTMEITILSAENLEENKKAIKGNVNTFVTVQCDGSNNELNATKLDSKGGSYPSWNEKLVMDVPFHARFITIEVKYKTRANSSTSVGMARIPISDFIGGYVHENQLQFLSYRLWDNRVRRNGVVNISVRLKVSQKNSCSNSMLSAVNGVPVAGNGSTGVVTGIPAVWLNYQRNL